MEETFDELVPVSLIVCFVDPVSQGAKSIDVSGGSKRKLSTMKFFPVICDRPTYRLWSQHAVIMFRDGQSGGPQIIFPMKSICLAAIIFLIRGIE